MTNDTDDTILSGCSLGVENRTKIQNLVASDIRQWQVIDKVRERLPIWAVFLIGGLMALLSAAITIITIKR